MTGMCEGSDDDDDDVVEGGSGPGLVLTGRSGGGEASVGDFAGEPLIAGPL